MSIKDRNLKPGTRLIGKYHKQQYSCQVVGRGSRQTEVSTFRWERIQESLGSGNGDHGPCLRRLDVLECGDRDRESTCGDSNSSGCQCHRKHQPDGSRVCPCCQSRKMFR